MSKKLLFNFNREVIQNYTYVKYVGTIITATNTLEKPIKSAILKGQTLLNLVPQKSGSFNGTRFLNIPLSHALKANTKYFVNFNVKESTLTKGVVCRLRYSGNNSFVASLNSSGIITTNALEFDFIQFYIENANDVANGLDAIVDDIMLIEYQEGMENWDIPYFTGMQSVKMPVLTTIGKNLWNDNDWSKGLTSSTGVIQTGGTYDGFRYNNELISVSGYDKIYCRTFAELDGVSGYGYRVAEYDSSKTFLRMIVCGSQYHTVSNDCEYIRVHFDLRYNPNQTVPTDDIPTYGVVATEPITSYEPYKTNILTVNEDVELRGIGEVQDELNLMTGEVTEHIKEDILNGSENWILTSDENDTTIRFALALPLSKPTSIVCEQFKVEHTYGKEYECIQLTDNKTLVIRISKTKATDLVSFKAWLSQNPIKIQYPLVTPVVKTVDLSILDQNENKVSSISSFNDTTHIAASSETIPPIFEGYLATKEVE